MLLDGTAVIANAIYIYLILVSGSVTLAAVFLTVRGFVNKGQGPLSSSTDGSPTLNPEPVPVPRVDESKLASSNANSSRKASQELAPQNVLERWRNRNDNDTAGLQPPVLNEILSTETTKDPGQLQNLDAKYPGSERKRYQIEDLIRMDRDAVRLPFEPREIRLSELLLPTVQFPAPPDTSKYWMDQELERIRRLVGDPHPANRCMGLFRLVSAASFHGPYTNMNHFHAGLCDFLESIITTLSIYSYASMLPALQLALVDLAATLLWEHWNWDLNCQLPSAAKVVRETIVSAGVTIGTVTVREPTMADNISLDKYSDCAPYGLEKHAEPDTLSQFDVFRLFCNLYLGTPVMAKPVRSRCIFKLSGIFYCCASRSKCDQHLRLAHLLEQALVSTDRDSIKIFFYDILLKLLLPHLYCCIKADDIFANGSVIQKLIFQGLWTDQPPAVRQKAAALVTVLSERFQEIVSWNKSMKFTHVTDNTRSGAPGSWLNFK